MILESRSFLAPLSDVVKSGINVLIWAGDADWICNWIGSQLVVNSVTYDDSAAFQAKALSEYTVSGTSFGQFKTEGNFNFMRVYEVRFNPSSLKFDLLYPTWLTLVPQAGHEVPYYQPVAALQVFTQIMKGEPLTST